MKSFTLSFVHSTQTESVLAGTTLLEALRKAGFTVPSPCGGQATCGKCRIKIVQGALPPTAQEIEYLSPDDLRGGIRLACQMKFTDDIRVDMQPSAVQGEIRILSRGEHKEIPLHPVVRKIHTRIAKPSLSDSQADFDRVLQAVRAPHARASLDLLRKLPQILRDGEFEVTVTQWGSRVLAVQKGDASGQAYGISVDIGTTTVVAYLMNLTDGKELAVRAASNPQRAFGDDVISRMDRSKNPAHQSEMHRQIVACLEGLSKGLIRDTGIPEENIHELVVTGNTAMSHLFLDVSPAPLAMAPYVPVFRDAVETLPSELGFTGLASAGLYLMPGIAGFVGGDIVAGILYSGMHREKELQLLIDIGTNGEIALGSEKELICCSTAAGPAFEGARIRHGMRAEPGAIEQVRIEKDLEITTIDNQSVKGICGTGLIDLIAELRSAELLDPTGRVLEPDEIPTSVSPLLRGRVVELEDGCGFRLARADESATGEEILLYPKDIREFQLAKAAIFAGVEILVKEMGATLETVDRVLLAGAFGNYIHVPSAIRAGLLPPFSRNKIRSIGNSAGAGAKMALLSQKHRRQAEEVSRKTRYVELAGRADFQEIFSEALLFPEKEMDKG